MKPSVLRKMEENKNSKNKTHSQKLAERAHDQPASVRAGPPKIKDILKHVLLLKVLQLTFDLYPILSLF